MRNNYRVFVVVSVDIIVFIIACLEVKVLICVELLLVSLTILVLMMCLFVALFVVN